MEMKWGKKGGKSGKKGNVIKSIEEEKKENSSCGRSKKKISNEEEKGESRARANKIVNACVYIE